ncbi:MAG: hypothetical protein IJ083_00930 [Clostridia bacterium]|nr:hypothetical protein [Clostridia bacterium]
MTVGLAVFDYIPVLLFALTGILLMRDLYNKLSKGAFALMAAGVIMVLAAGVYKATWKLVYTLGVADLYLLNNAFLPIQAAGFLLLGIGLVAGSFFPQGKGKVYAAAPLAAVPQERGAMVFIVFMVLGYLGFCGSMTRVAARMKKRGAVVLYVLSFALLMGMGYLGSREFGNDGGMNWIEEGVNTAAQLCLLAATLSLHKAGLSQKESL